TELHGDFDVRVDIALTSWSSRPGSVLRAALIAGLPKDGFQHRAYAAVRQAQQGPRDFSSDETLSAWFVNAGKTQFLPRKRTSIPRATVLRLERRGGELTASCLLADEGQPPGAVPMVRPQWVVLARFEKPCAEPVKLVLGVSNTAGTSTTDFPGLV